MAKRNGQHNKFTKNVYDIWMPMHFDRICSAIDQLPPDFDFEVPLLLQSGLSQDLESPHLSRLEQESLSEECGSQLDNVDPGEVPDTSSSGQGAKRFRRNAAK
ncbi:hypothetical protein I7I51_08866 [Histoplasma capsulatum]|uniref:DUF7924 domain-containing protein n=1 Tax=Ajellomyces capsulatus TaxID=5037 RepID=A0A8A1M0C0_AJECA|nr:hypothetical protein I7I51_08866 [Histoplasma capsulatum]